MSDASTIRATVADSYARKIQSERSCCGGTAALAGYDQEELSALPAESQPTSFGCGNPFAFAAIQSGEVVLDLGSGAGLDLLLAARRVGPTGRVIGVDMTPEMVAAARRNIATSGLDHVEIRQGLIEELPVEDASVDWVISNCVINLSPEKERVFREISRVLKPGGRFAISDLVVEDLPSFLRESAELYCACVAGAISESDYRAGLEAAGLSEVSVAERLVYDASQLAELASSEPALSSCCGSKTALRDLLAPFAGKVASVRFTGRKTV